MVVTGVITVSLSFKCFSSGGSVGYRIEATLYNLVVGELVDEEVSMSDDIVEGAELFVLGNAVVMDKSDEIVWIALGASLLVHLLERCD